MTKRDDLAGRETLFREVNENIANLTRLVAGEWRVLLRRCCSVGAITRRSNWCASRWTSARIWRSGSVWRRCRRSVSWTANAFKSGSLRRAAVVSWSENLLPG